MVLHGEKHMDIFTVCSHSGIGRMVQTVSKRYPEKRIRIIVG